MYKGQKYEYDEKGLAEYHKAKKKKKYKGVGHMPLDDKQAAEAIKELEKQKKRKLKKNGGPLSKG